jgi:hypothetical protein
MNHAGISARLVGGQATLFFEDDDAAAPARQLCGDGHSDDSPSDDRDVEHGSSLKPFRVPR